MAEAFLGVSLRYVLRMDPRYYDYDVNHDRIHFAVALVNFFKDFFKKININVFINTMEDDLISLIAYYSAKKCGVHIIGFSFSKFNKRGIVFTHDYSDLCEWNISKAGAGTGMSASVGFDIGDRVGICAFRQRSLAAPEPTPLFIALQTMAYPNVMRIRNTFKQLCRCI